MVYKITLNRLKEFLEHEADDTTKPVVVDMATCCVDALEKQIPKKPIRDPLDKAYLCPACNGSFTFWKCYETINNQPDYCNDCGQAIDWS